MAKEYIFTGRLLPKENRPRFTINLLTFVNPSYPLNIKLEDWRGTEGVRTDTGWL